MRISIFSRHPKPLLPAILGGGAGSKDHSEVAERLDWNQLAPLLIPPTTVALLVALSDAVDLSIEEMAARLPASAEKDRVCRALKELSAAGVVEEVTVKNAHDPRFALVVGRIN